MVFEKKVFFLQYLQKEQDNCGLESHSSVRWVMGVSKTAHNVITAPVLLARSLLETWPLIRRQKTTPPPLPKNTAELQTSNYNVNTDNTNKNFTNSVHLKVPCLFVFLFCFRRLNKTSN